MKAIKQIIDYLRERGVLTTGQLQGLATQGFLPWEEIFGPDEVDEKPEPPRFTPFPQDDEESEQPRVRHKAGGKKRDVVHKGPVLEPSDLCDRLTDRFEDWERPLEALMRLAQRLGPCESWEQAAVVLRNADPDAFCKALCAAVAAADPSLEALWESLSLEDYRDVVAESGAHGPAVTAYRAILQIDDPGQLGKHAWLLKAPVIRRVANVKAAQRRTLRACGFSFLDCPATFATAIRRDRRGLAYWAFVLLYSARRGEPANRPAPSEEERWPVRDAPSATGWMRAWAHAIAMEPNRGPLFLVEHNRRVSGQPGAVCRTLEQALHGLPIELSTLLTLIDEFGVTPAEADVSVPERLCMLADAVKTLRSAVVTDGGLKIPLDDDAVRTWETFLESWLRIRFANGYHSRNPLFDIETTGLVERSFGAKAELFCPKSWDWRSWT